MLRVITENINPSLPEDMQVNIPNHLIDKAWEKKTRADYDNAVKVKKLEIQNLQKSGVKDSIRVALYDLAEIHYKYGATYDALQMWSRSNDACVQREDYFKCSKRIAVAAFECINTNSSTFLTKFASNAAQFDDGKSVSTTSMIGVLDIVGRMMQGDFYRAAIQLTQMDQILAF